MAFCVNCGKENADGAKFCNGCGKQVEVSAAASIKEKQGNIHTCPNCGQTLESFQVRCPGCGHELNVNKVSERIKEFTETITTYDKRIAVEKTENATYKLVGWVILNFYTFAIPLIVRTIRRIVSPPAPKLTKTELVKVSYIENFIVPNNREEILEFCLFASSKVDNLMAGNKGKSWNEVASVKYWGKVWADKCKQVETRAGIVLSNDTQTLSIINKIFEKTATVMKKSK